MKRNEFLTACVAFSVAGGSAIPVCAEVSAGFDPVPGPWQSYRVVTSVNLAGKKHAMAWVPVPSFDESDWMRPGTTTWETNASHAEIVSDSRWNAKMLYAQWAPNVDTPRLVATSTVSTRNLDVALGRPQAADDLSAEERTLYLAPTNYIPTDGIVKETADRITAGASSDLDKVRRIYEWIVENTYRNPKTKGCGLGNITFLLESGDLGGKCADLNGLAVGLARASGIPARDLYGIRVAPSEFGYKSLGANTPDVTHSQHCRSEAYLQGYSWVPMDPADVRKVILEEPPGHLPLNDPKVVAVRRALLGSWEGNYMAYNDAHDLTLPGSTGPPVPFLMYPQAEIDGERLDSLDPANFRYAITAAKA